MSCLTSALLFTSTAALRTSLASKQRRPANIGGNLFVDESCIDCDTCRWMAPATYGRAGTKSYVHKQPEGDETANALAAAVACPTGSIRTQKPEPSMREVVDSFPLPIDAARLPRVFHLGYHAAASFGATPYLLCMPDGTNAMVDAPRFSSKLAKALEARGGVQLLLLSHMDDVADHNRWKERFPEMVRVMHARDVRGPDSWPYIDMRGVERQLEGAGPWELLPGLRAIHTPGHSAGSVSFLAEAALCGGAEGALFTGDHFCFSGRLGRLDGMARYGEDLPLQARSIAKLADEPFSWVLPGHGRRHHFATAGERAAAIRTAAEEFAADPMGKTVPGFVYVTPGPNAGSGAQWGQ